MRIPRVAGRIVVLAASVALLAGCASADVSTPTASPDSTPSPTPVEEVDVVETEPQTVFDGDCSRMLSLSDVSAIMGVDMPDGEPFYAAGDIAIRQLGGVYCGWHDPTLQNGAYLSLVVLPTRAGGKQTEDNCDPGLGCSFTATAADFDLFGVVDGPARDESLLPHAIAAKEAFTRAVAAEAVPDAYEPASAWSVPVDCAALDSSGAVATALGDPAVEGFLTGGDAEPNHGFYLASATAGAALCAWSAETGRLLTSILPGGAWIKDELAGVEGAEPMTVTGFESVLMIDDQLHFFVGDNWISASGDIGGTAMAPDAVGPLVASLVAALDATA